MSLLEFLGAYQSPPDILGTAISIVTFLIGYSRTIGVRNERTKSANTAIERMLVRRFVQENRMPTTEEISWVIKTKAQDYRVRPTRLLSEGQLINCMYTRVIESDFISKERREALLESLFGALEKEEERIIHEESFESLRAASRRKASTTLVVVLAVVASLFGSLLAASAQIQRFQSDPSEFLWMFIPTTSVSFLIISFLIFLYWFRDRQKQEPTKRRAISEYVRFESDVMRAVRAVGLQAQATAGRGSVLGGYDFVIESEGRKVLIEVKNWGRYVPAILFDRAVARLTEAMGTQQADEAVIVTRNTGSLAPTQSAQESIKVLTLREFRSYLRRWR